METKD
ncbi:hypothetical protein BpHYR1_015827 [Brachionus plicatilis]